MTLENLLGNIPDEWRALMALGEGARVEFKTSFQKEVIETLVAFVKRVIEAFLAYGLPEPVFEATQGGMAVTVFKAEPEGVSEGVNEGVSELLQLIKLEPGLRAPELSRKLETSLKNVERWLKQLRAAKKIEFRGAPKSGGYYLLKASQ